MGVDKDDLKALHYASKSLAVNGKRAPVICGTFGIKTAHIQLWGKSRALRVSWNVRTIAALSLRRDAISGSTRPQEQEHFHGN